MNVRFDSADGNSSAEVLLLPSWYLPFGGEFCREQAWHLNRAGVRADLLVNNSFPWRQSSITSLLSCGDKAEDDEGIYTYSRIHHPYPFPAMEEANIRYWTRGVCALFKRYVSHRGIPRLIHAHSSTWAGYAASVLSKEYAIPYVITEHRGIFGLRSQLAEHSFKPFYTPYLEKAFNGASRILTVSDQQVAKIKTYLHTDVPLEVLSNIVDTDFFVPSQTGGEAKTPGLFRFIAVNAYRDVKGYDILLPAFDKVCAAFPEVRLTIVGGGFDHPDFQSMLQQCRHREFIHFTGELGREGVHSHLQRSDAFVISSRIEAQSISVLEALSVGIPVVCTDPIPEYVVGGSEGIRVPVEDIEALAEAMCRMVRTAASYVPESLSAHVQRIASPAYVTKRLMEIYSEILLAKD